MAQGRSTKIVSMIKPIRTSRLPIRNSPSAFFKTSAARDDLAQESGPPAPQGDTCCHSNRIDLNFLISELLYRSAQRIQGGLAFMAHRLSLEQARLEMIRRKKAGLPPLDEAPPNLQLHQKYFKLSEIHIDI